MQVVSTYIILFHMDAIVFPCPNIDSEFCMYIKGVAWRKFPSNANGSFTGTEMPLNWQPWYSLEKLKTSFDFSCQYQSSQPDDLSVSVSFFVHKFAGDACECLLNLRYLREKINSLFDDDIR